jgi:hypothetical protein
MKKNGIVHTQRWDRLRVHAGIVLFIAFSSHLCAQPLATGHDKFLGNIVSYTWDKQFFLSYWNQVTPENAGKWASVETSRDVYQWNLLDASYTFAKSNNLPYKHHTLIWGQQQPDHWLSKLDSAELAEEVEEWANDIRKWTTLTSSMNHCMLPPRIRMLWVEMAQQDGTGLSGHLKKPGSTVPTAQN